MELITKTNKLKATLRKEHAAGRRLALVPTMGALHEGHLALVRHARDLAEGIVASICVNPDQLEPAERTSPYPRNLSHDAELLGRLDVDYVFAPPLEELLPRDFESHIDIPGLQDRLCGQDAPDRLRSFITTMAKLLTVIEPAVLLVGQKNAQEALLLRQLTRDLDFPTEVVVCPTVRERDGLALGSRNRRLSEAGRRAAPRLYRALCQAATLFLDGQRDPEPLRELMAKALAGDPLIQTEYIEIVDADHLQPVNRVQGRVLLAVAARVEGFRLTDNLTLSAP